jgi:very-short-patch-repair endonuclease
MQCAEASGNRKSRMAKSRLITGKSATDGIAKLTGESLPPAPKKKRKSSTDWEAVFLKLWQDHSGLPDPQQHVQLVPGRRWAVDFFIDPSTIVEIEGCIYAQGRHTRGVGYAEDCKKYNSLSLLGYTILRYTSDDLTKRPIQVIEEVKAFVLSQVA